VLVQLLHFLLGKEIQHVTCLLPCGLLNQSLRFCLSLDWREPSSLDLRAAFPREWSDYFCRLHVTNRCKVSLHDQLALRAIIIQHAFTEAKLLSSDCSLPFHLSPSYWGPVARMVVLVWMGQLLHWCCFVGYAAFPTIADWYPLTSNRHYFPRSLFRFLLCGNYN